MQKIILKIDGMMCGMCESHINSAIRNAFAVKKVKSSHSKGITEIITETDILKDELKAVIDGTGYELTSMVTSPFEKKSLFHRNLGGKR